MKNWRYALSILGLVVMASSWPGPAPGEHLQGETAYVKKLPDGKWESNFKVELNWTASGKSTLWRVTIDQDGCHMTPLGDGEVQQGT